MSEEHDVAESERDQELVQVERHAMRIVAVRGGFAVAVAARVHGDNVVVQPQRIELMTEHRR
jgi:hypothetical protein